MVPQSASMLCLFPRSQRIALFLPCCSHLKLYMKRSKLAHHSVPCSRKVPPGMAPEPKKSKHTKATCAVLNNLTIEIERSDVLHHGSKGSICFMVPKTCAFAQHSLSWTCPSNLQSPHQLGRNKHLTCLPPHYHISSSAFCLTLRHDQFWFICKRITCSTHDNNKRRARYQKSDHDAEVIGLDWESIP